MQPVMQVPLLDLAAQYAPIRDAVVEAVTRVIDTQKFILGPEVEAFESEAAAYLGARHAIGVTSGTDALLVAMMALELGPGDEVIVPTYSFFATAGCVSRIGATPVLVDIDPDTFNLDVEAVRRAITPRTRAIIPVHLYGQAVEMTPLSALAREHGLQVIEDAAQALGATYGGKALGTLGRFGCFSFYPSKNLGAAGDAGLVTVCECMARSAPIITKRSVATFAWPPCRPRCCASSCRTSKAGPRRVAATPIAIARCLPSWPPARRCNCQPSGRGVGTSTTSS
jgi:dTDP-4-amino-4,6-dideoxygalactose transaminase